MKAAERALGNPSSRGHQPLKFENAVTTTLPVVRSGGSLVVVVPKHLVGLLGLEPGAVLELILRKVVTPRIQPSEFERP